jgi:hypothetical protein
MKSFGLSALLLLMLGGFFLGFSGSVDDAHITFWAAQSLASEGEILNYNFERVEQSSALLQVLLLALLQGVSGISVVMLGHITTILAALAALFCTGMLARRLNGFSAGTAMILLSTSPFFVYWSFGGMESPLLALLLLLLLLVTDKYLRDGKGFPAIFMLSLAAQMTRPEMPPVLCAFALALIPFRFLLKISAWQGKSVFLFLLAQLLCAAILLGWRWEYFGALAPQPVSAKVGGSLWGGLQQGLQYFQQTWLDTRLLLSAVLVVAGFFYTLIRWRNPLAVLVVLFCLLYGAFVVASGGDWMAAGRFWAPIMPLLMVLVALVLHHFFISPSARYALLLLLVSCHIAYLWQGTAIDFNGVPLWKKTQLVETDHAGRFTFFERHAREHLHDIPTIAAIRPLLAKLLAERELQGNTSPVNIMAGQMGMVPFYLAQDFGRQLHFYDRNGITESTLTRCPAAAGLPRTRNGIGTGYQWIIENRQPLAACGFVMPDIVFDIETGWNRRNITALKEAGYVFVYRQRGHIFIEPPDALLPLRKIGAGQFIAVSKPVWTMLGEPAPVVRVF